MTDSEDGHAEFLPAELAAALRRSTAQTLNALHSLRVSLREHVRAERSRGASLAKIDDGLKDMIVVAGGPGEGDGYSEDRIDELTSQVLKWSSGFYS
jgi:hypothetical protein